MSHAVSANTPVIIGVGQFLQRDDSLYLDPVELAAEASRIAAADSGAEAVLSKLDAIAFVPVFSWRYRDPGPLLAAQIGCSPKLTMYPTMGGNTPQMLMNRLCERIVAGETSAGLLCGAEAVRAKARADKAGVELSWPLQDESVVPGWTESEPFMMVHEAELAHRIIWPTEIYPMFENALAHEAGRTSAEQMRVAAELWSGYSRVAATNPNAWDRTPYSVEDIATVSESNRIVGYPYTKHMVSNPDVNMAAATIVVSAQLAEALGVSKDRWVFPLAGTDGKDPYFSVRPSFTGSAAIAVAGPRALELAGVTIDDVEHLDVYSCFPSAVEIACKELDIDTSRQLSVYGGLCFGGGPWNNPVGHAIATMVEVLRNDPQSTGLVTANGGHIQKHSFGVYSCQPPSDAFRCETPQERIDAFDTVDVVSDYTGPATIETWTVMFERDGTAGQSHGIVRTPAGARTWFKGHDDDLSAFLLDEDRIGTAVTINSGGQLNLP